MLLNRRCKERFVRLLLTVGFLLSGLLIARGVIPTSVRLAAGSLAQRATIVTSRPNSRLIEAIRVGDRVLARGPDRKDSDTGSTEVDPSTWKKVRLYAEQRWSDRTVDDIHIETLRPPAWLQTNNAHVGATVTIPLDLAEMGIDPGVHARILDIEDCPKIAKGRGRVVLTTVNHRNNCVYDLTVRNGSGGNVKIGVTAFHKVYSADRSTWVSASTLRLGETLRAVHGTAVVAGLSLRHGVERVYNLTVESEHVYHVGISGILVHNSGCGAEVTDEIMQLWKAPGYGVDGASQVVDGFNPAQYPGMGPFFGAGPQGQEIAQSFQYNYQNGLQQFNVPANGFNALQGTVIFPDPSPQYPPGAAWHVPPEGLEAFNDLLQSGPPNVFYPEGTTPP